MARSASTEILRARATKHGMRFHRLYVVYQDMLLRCYDAKCALYKYYGARGISVCNSWREDRNKFFFWALGGWKRGLTLDRENNNGDYSPDNCRWVTTRRNNRNRRGVKLNIEDAAAIKDLAEMGVRSALIASLYGVSYHSVYAIKRGTNWPDAEQYKWTGRAFE